MAKETLEQMVEEKIIFNDKGNAVELTETSKRTLLAVLADEKDKQRYLHLESTSGQMEKIRLVQFKPKARRYKDGDPKVQKSVSVGINAVKAINKVYGGINTFVNFHIQNDVSLKKHLGK